MYVLVSMMAGPRFLSHVTTRTLVRDLRLVIALSWNGRRLGIFALRRLREESIVRRNNEKQVCISSGMSQSLGIQVEGKCICGMKYLRFLAEEHIFLSQKKILFTHKRKIFFVWMFSSSRRRTSSSGGRRRPPSSRRKRKSSSS